MPGKLIDPTLDLSPMAAPLGPSQPSAAPGMEYQQMLAQALQDPQMFQQLFGGNEQSTDIQKEAIQRQMALAQALQTAPPTGGEGPGATGASGALGGLRHSLGAIRGAMIQQNAMGQEKDLQGQVKNDLLGKTRLSLALKSMEPKPDKGLKDLNDRTDALRREYMGDQVVKDTLAMDAMHRKVVQSYALSQSDGQGAGDMGLVYGIMKIMDPSSSVREGEVAMANQVGGAASQFLNLYNQMVQGGKLSQGARNQLLNLANRQFGAQLETYKTVGDQYSALAQRIGAKPEDVVLPFDFKMPATPKAQKTGPQPGRRAVRDQSGKLVGYINPDGSEELVK